MGKLFEDLCRAAATEHRLWDMLMDRVGDIFGSSDLVAVDYNHEDESINLILGRKYCPTREQLHAVWELGAKRLFVYTSTISGRHYFYVGGPIEGKEEGRFAY